MKRLTLPALAAGLALGLFLAVNTAPAQDIVDPDAKLVEAYKGPSVSTLQVSAPQPAWWVVSSGGRTVRILGVLWEYPTERAWDQRQLKTHLSKARSVFLPSIADDRADVARSQQPTLAPEMVSRISWAAQQIGVDPASYAGLDPVSIGQQLISDHRDRLGLSPERIVIDVEQAARTVRRDIKYISRIQPDRLGLGRATDEAGVACLNAAIEEIAAGRPAFDKAVLAWRSGDVRGALTAPRGFEKCSFARPGYLAVRERIVSDHVAVLDAALAPNTYGDHVAVIELRTLLAEDGVLERLARKGYKITAPGGA